MKRWLLAGATLLWAAATEMDDIAPRAGVTATLVSGSATKRYILESMAGGVALFDYNKDGWLDIYLTNGSTIEGEIRGNNQHQDTLYRNNRDGTFTGVTGETGLGDRQWTMGVAIADVNNDGFDDIYLTNYGTNRLYLNSASGVFRDASRESGAALAGWSSSAAFADYDRDGDLDLYVSQYLEFDIRDLPKDSALCRYRGIAVQCGPRGMTPSRGRLLENDGTGRFRDVSVASGIAKAEASFGLGAVWGDYDNDGDPDLYAANDSLPNYLFRNNGNKTFTEAGLQAGVALTGDGREQAGMGVDFGDYDNDGDLDLIVTNFSDDYTTLYRNDGAGQFSDVSHAAGIVQPTWAMLSWGVQFADLDNDGLLDIVAANGHVYPEVDRHDLGTKYRQPPNFFRNSGAGRFREMPAFTAAAASRGLAIGDLDNDGALDIVVANLDAAPWVIRGASPRGNWMQFNLRGTASNRNAVGARVTVKTRGASMMREVNSGGSYQSHSDFRLHFGLGAATSADEVLIRWPTGAVQKVGSIKAGEIREIVEPARPPTSSRPK